MEISEQLSSLQKKLKQIEETVLNIKEYDLPITDVLNNLVLPPRMIAEMGLMQYMEKVSDYYQNGGVAKISDVVVLQKSPSVIELNKQYNNEVNNSVVNDVDLLDCMQTSLSGDLCNYKDSDGNHPITWQIGKSKFCQPNLLDLNRRKEKRMSKIDIPILERLKDYECTIEHRYNPKTKRTNKVVICKYDGCGKEFNKTWNILDHLKN